MTKTETFLKCSKCAAQLLLNTQQGGIAQNASVGEITHFMATHAANCFMPEELTAGSQPIETIVIDSDE